MTQISTASDESVAAFGQLLRLDEG